MRIIASYSLSAFNAIVITDIHYGIEDTVTSGYYYDSKISGLRQRIIHSTGKGYYINVYGRRYYLHDFIKNDF